MTPTNSIMTNEIDMEMVPEKYIDVITCEFAYDPVRLPLNQDPTGCLYDRKTLETIWETKCQAENPFTKQWFNAKSVIPQTELRQEMEDYIKLQKSSASRGVDLEVIEEYTKILEAAQMKQYFDILLKPFSEQLTIKKQCSTMWKKINLLRLYCQFDSKNIETSISLHGIRYLNEVIYQMIEILRDDSIEKDTKEVAWDVCKEIAKAIDVIGLKTLDLHYADKPKEIVVILGYYEMINGIFQYNETYMKVQSLMLRMFCKIFLQMGVEVEEILGKKIYENIVEIMGNMIVIRNLSETNVKDISSEDLYYGISILQRSWIKTSSFDPLKSQTLINSVNICVAREIETSDESTNLSEEQFCEAETEARHNCEALEKGLCLIKDILMTEGPSAAKILQGGLYVVEEIVRMFEHFISQAENEDATSGHGENERSGPVFCRKKGCKIYECIHSKIAQLGSDIFNTAIWKSGRPPFDIRVLLKFFKF